MAGMLDRVFIAVPDLETILKLKDESPNLGDVTRLGRRDSRLEACRFGERLPRSPTRAAGHSLNHSSTMSARDSRRYQRRSRSPRGYSDLPDSRDRQWSRSPRSHHHSSSHQHKRPKPSLSVILPLNASPLSKQDFETYKPMFGLYLDIQKQLILEELADDEVKGRWKSFVGKWYENIFCFMTLFGRRLNWIQ